LPFWLCCIASRKTSTLPKCWTGSASPAIRAPGTTGIMPGGAIRNAIFRRSAASAISGVESLLKAERDCSFTHPEEHGIEERKLEIWKGDEARRASVICHRVRGALWIRNRPSRRKDQLIFRVRECCSQPKLYAARLRRSRDQRREDRRGRFA